MSEPLETRVVTVPTALSTHLKDAVGYVVDGFLMRDSRPRITLMKLAEALIDYSGAESESIPHKGVTPKVLNLRHRIEGSNPNNALTITRASWSIGRALFLAHVTYEGHDCYRIDRVGEFPNRKTLAEFNPTDYLSPSTVSSIPAVP